MSHTVQPERVQLGDGGGLKQGVSMGMERFRDFFEETKPIGPSDLFIGGEEEEGS